MSLNPYPNTHNCGTSSWETLSNWAMCYKQTFRTEAGSQNIIHIHNAT
jgi:hypothetical protein